jgi:hypothetical protein
VRDLAHGGIVGSAVPGRPGRGSEPNPRNWRDIEWTNHYQPDSRSRITTKPLGVSLEADEV